MDFFAIDGEGRETDGLGRQAYQLMAGSNGQGMDITLNKGRPLSAAECLDWMLDEIPEDHIVIAFAFGYDTAQILRQLPSDILFDLYHREERLAEQPPRRYVYWGHYGIDFLPGKSLSIWTVYRSLMIHDVFGFFQKSFITAMTNWQTWGEDERLIREGKERRYDDDEPFDYELEGQYSLAECAGLCRMMDKVRNSASEAGYPLRAYNGSGSLAQAMLSKHNVMEYCKPVPEEMDEICARGYFGGRFEGAMFGAINQTGYLYDIASAYPYQMTMLPCLAHGSWKYQRKYNGRKIGIWHVRWKDCTIGSDFFGAWGVLPFRDEQGNISFPSDGEGWYWSQELGPAIAVAGGTIKAVEGWVWHPSCSHTPFDWIPADYQRRREAKERGELGLEMVLKLGLNSLYGKTAQTVGQPKVASWAWAGMITAGTRGQLLTAVAQNPDKIVATATDSVLSLTPLDLPMGKRLGEWELTEQTISFYAQSGLWLWEGDGSKPRSKTRGISADRVPWDALAVEWGRMFAIDPLLAVSGPLSEGTSVPVSSKSTFIGLNIGLARGKPETIGQWVEPSKKITVGDPIKRFPTPDRIFDTFVGTMTVPGHGGISAPYKKMLPDANDEDIDLRLMQPDAQDG